MSPEDQAAARAFALDSDPRLPRRRVRVAVAAGCRDRPQDDASSSWPVRCDEEYVPLLLEELELDGVDASRRALGSPHPRGLEVGLPMSWSSGRACRACTRGHPPRPGRHPVHDRREEPGGGRHVVREPLPGLSGRRGQPLLLLLVRPERRLDRVLRPPARAAALLRALHPRSHGVIDHIRFETEVTGRDAGTTRRSVEGRRPDRRTGEHRTLRGYAP
jgi:hypothetical protein